MKIDFMTTGGGGGVIPTSIETPQQTNAGNGQSTAGGILYDKGFYAANKSVFGSLGSITINTLNTSALKLHDYVSYKQVYNGEPNIDKGTIKVKIFAPEPQNFDLAVAVIDMSLVPLATSVPVVYKTLGLMQITNPANRWFSFEFSCEPLLFMPTPQQCILIAGIVPKSTQNNYFRAFIRYEQGSALI
jgi:hypothetical protein